MASVDEYNRLGPESRRAPQKPSFAGCIDRHISLFRKRRFGICHECAVDLACHTAG